MSFLVRLTVSNSRSIGFLNSSCVLGARSNNFGKKNVAEGATGCCSDIGDFCEKSKNRVVELVPISVEILHCSGEQTYSEGKETSAELIVERNLVQRGRNKVD